MKQFFNNRPRIYYCFGSKTLYVWIQPSIHWIKPKKIVKCSAITPTQNVYHWTQFLRSHHHCEMLHGLASSKACFNITSRSRQNMKFSICRSSAFSLPRSMALWSRIQLLAACCFWNHFLVSGPVGSKSASVRRVSSTNPSGKRSLLTLELRSQTTML